MNEKIKQELAHSESIVINDSKSKEKMRITIKLERVIKDYCIN